MSFFAEGLPIIDKSPKPHYGLRSTLLTIGLVGLIIMTSGCGPSTIQATETAATATPRPTVFADTVIGLREYPPLPQSIMDQVIALGPDCPVLGQALNTLQVHTAGQWPIVPADFCPESPVIVVEHLETSLRPETSLTINGVTCSAATIFVTSCEPNLRVYIADQTTACSSNDQTCKAAAEQQLAASLAQELAAVSYIVETLEKDSCSYDPEVSNCTLQLLDAEAIGYYTWYQIATTIWGQEYVTDLDKLGLAQAFYSLSAELNSDPDVWKDPRWRYLVWHQFLKYVYVDEEQIEDLLATNEEFKQAIEYAREQEWLD